jgi:hypothetical protein
MRVSLVYLQKLTLKGWVEEHQHSDVGTRAEHALGAAGHFEDLHLRVLEAQTLDRVAKLDVDAEVVAVELELVAFGEGSFRVDAHRELGLGTVEGEAPVAVLVRARLEVDHACALRGCCRRWGEGPSLAMRTGRERVENGSKGEEARSGLRWVQAA